MAKRKFILTQEAGKELLGAYLTCKEAGTRTRYQAVRLYREGIQKQRSSRSAGVVEPV